MGEWFIPAIIIGGVVAGILLFARLVNGPFGEDRDKPLPVWEWYRFDREPDPEHGGETGHWVEWKP